MSDPDIDAAFERITSDPEMADLADLVPRRRIGGRALEISGHVILAAVIILALIGFGAALIHLT